MDPFDILTIIGGACALLMVLGAMILLYKGTITLSKADPKDALSIQYKKLINVQTRYPALALFIIGLAFLGLSLYLSKTNSERPFEVLGKLKSDNPEAAVIIGSVAMLQTNPSSDGGIDALIYPRVDAIKIEIVTPGYAPGKITRSVIAHNIHDRFIRLGELDPGTKITEKPAAKPENIVAVPANLPPLQQGGNF